MDENMANVQEMDEHVLALWRELHDELSFDGEDDSVLSFTDRGQEIIRELYHLAAWADGDKGALGSGKGAFWIFDDVGRVYVTCLTLCGSAAGDSEAQRTCVLLAAVRMYELLEGGEADA